MTQSLSLTEYTAEIIAECKRTSKKCFEYATSHEGKVVIESNYEDGIDEATTYEQLYAESRCESTEWISRLDNPTYQEVYGL